jgi:hypothetical protein
MKWEVKPLGLTDEIDKPAWYNTCDTRRCPGYLQSTLAYGLAACPSGRGVSAISFVEFAANRIHLIVIKAKKSVK